MTENTNQTRKSHTMKVSLIIGLFLAASLGVAGNAVAAGSEAIIKQRAKELSNENNVRQGVPPPSAPQPGQGAPAAQPPSGMQQSINRLQTDIAAIKQDAPVTDSQQLQLTKDMIAGALGPVRPSQQKASKLSKSISSALAQKALSPADRARLVTNLSAILNGSSMGEDQAKKIGDDVQAIFQNAGLDRKQSVGVADDLNALSEELRKAPK
jgi:hypothetical protein